MFTQNFYGVGNSRLIDRENGNRIQVASSEDRGPGGSGAFREGQRGSSAMPHKKNPIICERLTGMARIVRSYVLASLENISLWHERDISHSSVERIIFSGRHYASLLHGRKVSLFG